MFLSHHLFFFLFHLAHNLILLFFVKNVFLEEKLKFMVFTKKENWKEIDAFYKYFDEKKEDINDILAD